VEKVVAGPVEKVVANHSGGEGRWETRWRERRDGEEGDREHAVARAAQWREGRHEARWRWRVGCTPERSHGLAVLR
jgi:hypothetical protein